MEDRWKCSQEEIYSAAVITDKQVHQEEQRLLQAWKLTRWLGCLEVEARLEAATARAATRLKIYGIAESELAQLLARLPERVSEGEKAVGVGG